MPTPILTLPIKFSSFVIDNVTNADYFRLIEVWEASVRATHHFLSEDDIIFYRELILEKYFDLVDLVCVRHQSGAITGFLGTIDHKIEMLFIHPDYRGKGIGKRLIRFAIDMAGIQAVDVNEQNEQAVGFYLALGFRLNKRSALDGMGKPYPVLHLLIDHHTE